MEPKTSRKATEFRPKSAVGSIRGRSRPPRAGPRKLDMFSRTPPRTIAEGSTSLETTSGTTDIHAGALHANPTHKKNTAARMIAGVNKWSADKNARPPAARESQICIAHKM